MNTKRKLRVSKTRSKEGFFLMQSSVDFVWSEFQINCCAEAVKSFLLPSWSDPNSVETSKMYSSDKVSVALSINGVTIL